MRLYTYYRWYMKCLNFSYHYRRYFIKKTLYVYTFKHSVYKNNDK